MKIQLYNTIILLLTIIVFWSCENESIPLYGELNLVVLSDKQEYIEGAEIAVAAKQNGQILFTRRSGVRGKIGITNLTEGEHLIYATDNSYLSDTLTVSVAPGVAMAETLVLGSRYGDLELLVVGDDNHALKGINVTVKTKSDEVLITQEDSNNEGKIILNDLPGKEYVAFASDEEYVSEILSFEIIPGELNKVTLIAVKVENYAGSMNKDGYLNPSEMPPYGVTYSISGMIKPTGTGIRTISGFGNAQGFASFFRLEGDNHLYLGQWSGAFKKARSGEAVVNDVWSHVVLVVNNNEVSFYINGVNVGVNYTNGSAPMDNAITPDNFKFGALFQTAFNFAEAYNGSLDNLAFWTKARNSEEIKAEAANGLTGNESGLWGYWDFDDNAGTTTIDLSGSGHSLEIGGGAKIYLVED